MGLLPADFKSAARNPHEDCTETPASANAWNIKYLYWMLELHSVAYWCPITNWNCHQKCHWRKGVSEHAKGMLIPLSQGLFAKVDAGDFERAAKHKWTAQRSTNLRGEGYYAVMYTEGGRKDRKRVQLQQFILGDLVGDGQTAGFVDVDDTLDCRRGNLRVSDPSKNGMGARIGKNNTSGYKGVSWRKKGKKWGATIQAHGRKKWLGSYATKEEAYEAYAAAAISLYGEFARI